MNGNRRSALGALSGACASVLLVAVFSCDGGDQSPLSAAAPVVVDSAGVSITINSGPLQPIDLRSEPVMTIDAGNDPEFFFFDATAAEKLSTGALVIANSGTHELLFFDGRGSPVRKVGGEGSGPGEFRGIGAMRTLNGDTIAVNDGRNRRVTVFDSVGSLIRDVRYITGETAAPDGGVCTPGITLGLLHVDIPLFTSMACFDATTTGLKSQRAT